MGIESNFITKNQEVDNTTIIVNGDGQLEVNAVDEIFEHELEIIEIQANNTLTPIDHDTLISETFSDSDGYNNLVNTGNSDATFDTNKYKRVNTSDTTQVVNSDGTATGLTVGAVSSTIWRMAQSFNTTGTWQKVKVYINNIVGTPSGLKCVVYADNGSNAPDTGTVIATGTLAHSSVVTGALNEVIMDTSWNGSTKRWLVWQTIDENETGTTNYDLSYTNTSSYANGNMKTWNGSSWTDYSAADVRCEVSSPTSTNDSQFVEIDLPTISGSVIATQLIINDVERETGDNVTYEIEDTGANKDTSQAINTKNTTTNLTTNPTKLRVNLVPKTTSPTTGYPSVKSVCLKLWKA